MKKSIFALVFVVFACALSACAHLPYGPSDDPTDAAFVRAVQVVVDNGEDLKFVDKVYWFPKMAAPSMGPYGTYGTIVVTDKNLYVLGWNRNTNAFDVRYKQPVTDIVNAEHITSIYGPGDYISVESKNKRFDLYTVFAMFAADDMIEKNRELLGCLTALKIAN